MEDNQGREDQPSDTSKQTYDRRRLRRRDSEFPTLGTVESESESDYDEEDYAFFESAGAGFAGELGFLREDYSDDDEDGELMDDDDEDDDGIDVDELTYEELIALGEFIGVERRGLSVKEISSCLRPVVPESTSLTGALTILSAVDRCVVCQVEYEDGEDDLVALLCAHAYHSECITQWLQIKKCCPICSYEVSPSPETKNSNVDQK